MNESRSIIVAVIACTFFAGFGGGVVFPVLPNLGTVLGISPFVVGLILSMNRIARLVANAPAGALVDRIGTRTPLIVGLAAQGVATMGYVVALDSPLPEAWFLGSRVVWGAGSALVFATAYTISADVSESGTHGTNMGLVRAGVAFGFPAGLVLGGVVSDLYSVRLAFVTATAFALLGGVLAYLVVPETHRTEPRGAIKPWEVDRRVPTITVGVVNFSFFFTYIGVLFATLVLFLQARSVTAFGFGSQGTSGLLMAVIVASGAVFMILGGKLSDVLGARVPVLLGFIGMVVVGFLLVAAATSLRLLVVGCVFIGCSQGGAGGPLMAMLVDMTPTDRMGRAAGTNNVLGDVGAALGPLVSLPLVKTVGFVPVYVGCAVVLLLAGVVLLAGTYLHTGSLSPRVEAATGD